MRTVLIGHTLNAWYAGNVGQRITPVQGTLLKSGDRWFAFVEGWRAFQWNPVELRKAEEEKGTKVATPKGVKYYSGKEVQGMGMRWVTIRGSHVLIKPTHGGNWVVVGGAGGRLNHLQINKLLNKEEYTARKKQTTEKEKERREQELRELTPEEKKQHIQQRRTEVHAKRELRSEYRTQVEKIVGANLRSQLSLEDMQAIERKATKAFETRAKRAATETDKVEIEKVGEKIAEKEAVRKVKSVERQAVETLMNDYLGEDVGPNDKKALAKLIDKDKAMKILTARAEFRKQLKKIGYTKADVPIKLRAGDVFAATSDNIDDKIMQEVAVEAETQKNLLLYGTLDAQGEAVQKYVDRGATIAMNGIISDIEGGGAVFAEATIKELGVEAVAQAVAMRTHEKGKADAVRKALEEYSDKTRMQVVSDALENYNERMEMADKMRELAKEDPTDGEALLSMASANGHALRQINQAQSGLGNAVGSLQSMAHVINALQEPRADAVLVDMGRDLANARLKAKRAGLKKGQYVIKTDKNGRLVMEIPKESLDAFFKQSAEKAQADDIVTRIKQHKENDGYIPPGMKGDVKLQDSQEAGLRFFKQQKHVLLDFEAGLGKEQPLTAKILTPTGWTTMGSLKVGDQVITENGKSTQVVGVYPQGVKSIYRLTFSDGSQTECGLEHLWKIKKPYDVWKKNGWRIVKLADLLRGTNLNGLGQPAKKGLLSGHHRKYRIPVVAPVKFAAKKLPIDPYALGILIGDGGLTQGTPKLSSADPFIVQRIQAVLPKIEIRKCKGDNVDYSLIRKGWTRGKSIVNPLKKELTRFGLCVLSKDKSIPRDYLFGNVDQRLQLLRGLMDSDGWVSKDGSIVQFTSMSKELALDVQHLVQSLGGIARLSSKIVYSGTAWNVNLNVTFEPFSLPRKLSRFHPTFKYAPTRYLVDVRYCGKKEAQCIQVEDETQTYVTDDFIVTHNTAVAYAAAMEAFHNMGAKKALFVVPATLRAQMKAEANKFLEPDQAKNVFLNGADSKKKARLNNYARESGITIVGHDQLRMDIDEIEKAGYGMIVVDEIHEITAGTGKAGRFSAMRRLRNIPLKIGMSGTNIANTKREVYRKIDFLDPDHNLGTLESWEKKYRGVNQSTGAFTDSATQAFRKEVAPWVYSQKMDLPVKNTIETRRIPLTKDQRRRYAESERLYGEERGKGMAGAAARRDSRNYAIIQDQDFTESGKLDEVISIFEKEAPTAKAALHVFGREAMETTRKALEAKFGRGCAVTINGDSSQTEVERAKKAFNDPDSPVRFIVGTKSLESGHNLQGGTYTIHLDQPDTWKSFEQRTKRVYRRGQTHDTNTIVLSGTNPYDIRREDLLKRKRGETEILGNPREIEAYDDTTFLGLLNRHETEALKKGAKA